MRRTVLTFTMLASGISAPTTQTSAFEAASIKPASRNSECANGSVIGPMTGGGLRVECLPLRSILTWAYEVQDFQISGGPSWMKSDLWEIRAKAEAPETAQEGPLQYEKMSDAQRSRYMETVRGRLKALLAERFQLAIHRETREQTVYSLALAKSGPKLKEAADQSSAGLIRRGRGLIIGKGAAIESLASFLAIDVARPVTNNTGLTAHYDFELKWTPDSPAGADADGKAAPTDVAGPTVFTALEEQLGLRLESRKGPMEMLIVDRVEKPSAN